MNIKPLDVDVLDRALLPRDVVFNNQEQLGTILDVQKKGDFVIVGTDKKLKDIDVNDLHFYSEFIGGQPVCIGPWIGQVISVDRMVYLKTACGARACVPEHLLNVISLIEDPYPHPSDKSEFELQGAAASIFYPGQTLIMLSRAAPFLTWSKKTNWVKNKIRFAVQWVDVVGVKVRWLQSCGFSSGDDSYDYWSLKLNVTPDKPPSSEVTGEMLKHLKHLNQSRASTHTLGHRFMYTLTEEDVHQLNKPLKKRKRKLKQRKHRNELADRKQRRKMNSSSANSSRRRLHRSHQPIPEDDSFSDEYEDWKEIDSTKEEQQEGGKVKKKKGEGQDAEVSTTTKTNNSEVTGESVMGKDKSIEHTTSTVVGSETVDTGDKSVSADGEKKADGEHQCCGEDCDLFRRSYKDSDDDDDESTGQKARKYCNKFFTHSSSNMKAFGARMLDKIFLIRIDVLKAVPELADELFAFLCDRVPSYISMQTVKYYVKHNPLKPFVLCIECRRRWSKSSSFKAKFPLHSTIENTEYLHKSRNVTFQAAQKIQYFVGQQVCLEMAMPHTSATVEWQDGSVTENVSTLSLSPIEAYNEHDFFPGDFVNDMRTTDDDLFKYGVVQKVLIKKRMAKVHWCTFKNTKHVDLGDEEVSIYDLQGSSDYKFHFSHIVYRYGQVDGQITNFARTQACGQVAGVTGQGRLKVKWTDESTSEVYPHEVLLFNEDEFGQFEGTEYDDFDSVASSLSDDGADLEEIDDQHLVEDAMAVYGDDSDDWKTIDGDSEDDLVDMSVQPDDMEILDQLFGENGDPIPTEEEMAAAELAAEGDKNKEEEEEEEEEEQEPVVTTIKGHSCMSQFEMLAEAPKSHKFYDALLNSTTSKSKAFLAAHRKDIKLFSHSLPRGVYIRAYEDRMDLMSVLLAAPDNTPFRDGLFVFEVHFPSNYPQVPPKVHYIALTPRLNPNLYENGTVCVSLLGTWSGRGSENWTKESNLLQVLLSIQALILVKEPYFNEAGYESQRGTVSGELNSRWYTDMVVLRMVQHVTKFVTSTPQPFKDDAELKALMREIVPSFLARNRKLLAASQGVEDLEKDLSELSGFPLRTLSQGVIGGLKDKLDYLEKCARENGMME